MPLYQRHRNTVIAKQGVRRWLSLATIGCFNCSTTWVTNQLCPAATRISPPPHPAHGCVPIDSRKYGNLGNERPRADVRPAPLESSDAHGPRRLCAGVGWNLSAFCELFYKIPTTAMFCRNLGEANCKSPQQRNRCVASSSSLPWSTLHRRRRHSGGAVHSRK